MRSGPLVLAHPNPVFVALTLSLLLSLLLAPVAWAQTVVNGQIMTNGLAIINAPAMNSQLHAGSNLHLSVEVSANGKLSPSSFLPGSSQSTRYDSLEIYLVSRSSNLNLTVSGNTTLLEREGSSTVKHMNWPIPSCVTSGEYNLMIYEGSHVDDRPFFSITAIPILILNAGQSGSCPGNDLQLDPQDDSPAQFHSESQAESPSGTPVLSTEEQSPGNTVPPTGEQPSGNTVPAAPTQPASPGNPSENPSVITIVISGSGPLPFDFPTVTVTDFQPPVTRTVVIESPVTLTSIIPGPTDSVTVTITTMGQSTTTVVSGGDGVFAPIGSSGLVRYPLAPWSILVWIGFGWVSMFFQ